MTKTNIHYINKNGRTMYELVDGYKNFYTEEELDKKAKRFGWTKEYRTFEVHTSEELFKEEEEHKQKEQERIINENKKHLDH